MFHVADAVVVAFAVFVKEEASYVFAPRKKSKYVITQSCRNGKGQGQSIVPRP